MKETTLTGLQERIRELEQENAVLRREFTSVFKEPSVDVPIEMKPLFDKAQQTVSEYFTGLRMEPSKGTIEINDQRYVLVRASALSKDFLDTIKSLYADRGEAQAMSIGKNFLFDIAHVIVMNDAREFHQRMQLKEPIEKLSAGPLHFAYTGWAYVEILAESNPSPDENFCLVYRHPYSFEADSWKRSGKISDVPVCIMNAGYSSGWCEESFGIPLTAVEISCIAKGDDTCTFIMSPPHKIKEHIERFTQRNDADVNDCNHYDIPTFFDRKRVEEEMHRSKQLAEESAKSKEDFVANMSHELRTPLGAILGFAELLKKTKLNTEQREYLEAIQGSGNNLLGIINDILDLSKLDAGRLTTEDVPFSLPELMHSLQIMFAVKAAEKGLDFKVYTSPSITYHLSGDSMRLTQILVNLIGNAIKFTHKGKVTVFCDVQQEDKHTIWLDFSIADTGIGVPKEKVEKIFERFSQADTDTTRKYGGTGLGLSITRQLIELLDGSISMQSVEGKGTTFSFSLPFKKVSGQPFLSEVTESTFDLDTSKTVLVVEDNFMNQKLTSIILQNNGLPYHLAENGQEAIEFLKSKQADVILMDLQMPVMDGYQATCAIRDELKLATPIIAMTAHALAGEKEKCFQLGVNDYLPKPFTERELLQKLAQWTNGQHEARTKRLVDLSFLVKQTRNNSALIEEMVTHFRRQFAQEIEQLKIAVGKGDYHTIYKTAHHVRNAIGLFGLTPLIGEDLLVIEKCAHEQSNMDDIKKSFAKIEAVTNQVIEELNESDITALL